MPSVRRVPYSVLSFNVRAGRYQQANGRFLSKVSVREVVERDIEHVKAQMEQTAWGLQSGELTLQQFRDRTAVSIRSLHLAQYAAGAGGFHNLTQADYGRAGAAIKEQYKYLNDWTQRMATQPELIQDGVPGQMKVLDRIGMYSDASLSSFESGALQADIAAGLAWESNFLEADGHQCSGKGSCQEQTALGEVPIGTLILIGKRKCGPRCRCMIHRTRERTRT